MIYRNSFSNTLISILGMIIFIGLFIASLFIFSYLFIAGAILGLILLVIAKIRQTFGRKRTPTVDRTTIRFQQSNHSSRIIDQDDQP